MKKSECTPEQWSDYLARIKQYRLNNLEAERARLREYNQRPEVKARRKAHDAKPEVRLKRLARAQTDEAKQLAKARQKQRYGENPQLYRERLEAQRERRTGFSAALIDTMRLAQKNRCAICASEFSASNRICADHCHDSGVPRGLLCHYCNTAEGLLKQMKITPLEFAERLTKYLAAYPAKPGITQPELPSKGSDPRSELARP